MQTLQKPHTLNSKPYGWGTHLCHIDQRQQEQQESQLHTLQKPQTLNPKPFGWGTHLCDVDQRQQEQQEL